MKMWMIDPALMCFEHIETEHQQLHSEWKYWQRRKNTSILGLIKQNAFEPSAYKKRHDELEHEILKRGYCLVDSAIEQPDFSYLPLSHQAATVSLKRSWRRLFDNCKKCRRQMTQVTGERFTLYQPLIEKSARIYASKFHTPIENARSNAQFGMAMILLKPTEYDPTKGTLEKWISVQLNYYMKEVYLRGNHVGSPSIKESNHYSNEITNCELDTSDCRRIQTGWLNSIMHEFSDEALAVIDIICEAPTELANTISAKPRRTQVNKQHNLMAYLIDTVDWPLHKVEAAFKELKQCLR